MEGVVAATGNAGISLNKCRTLCEQLRDELSNAIEIPSEKLSGEFADALRAIRKIQYEQVETISNQIKELSMR